MIQLLKGDCLIESDKIKTGSVDLILTDLPYGTVKDIRSSPASKTTGLKVCEWDITIDTNQLFKLANRILRKNGKMVLTAQDPFATELKNKAIPSLPFDYSMIWEKDHFANCLLAKKAPLSYFEYVLVFGKCNPKNEVYEHPLRDYFEKQRKLINHLNFAQIGEILNVSRQQVGNWLSPYKMGWNFPTQEKYMLLQKLNICTKPYNELKQIDDKYKKQMHDNQNELYPSTFNLWEGNKYKSNILKYKKDYDGHHPTQKPILLLEDLIKTFSNENDLVVDLTMGSGST